MKRWKGRAIWRGLKRGITSLLVCAAIIILPLLGLRQWHADFGLLNSTNKATPLPAFVPRPADSNKKPPRLYKEPLITITFDDGWETTYTIAAPLLTRDGIHSTQYLVSNLLDNPAYLSLSQVKVLQQHGQQIACHTVSHPDLTKVTAQELNYQLRGCQQFFIKQHFGTLQDFAAPYGDTNPTVIAGIKQVFRSERNTNGDLSNGVTDADINVPGDSDPYNIIGVTIHENTTVAQLKQAVDYTVVHNGWLVLTYHQSEEAGSKFSLSSASLQKQLAYLSSTPVRIVTMGQVMDNLPPAPKGQ
jgi:peptidoglycan/xylan/chitin deacetylase (PgdA/CDA1 family)